MNNLGFDQILFSINKIYTEKTNSNLKEFNITRSDMSFLLALNKTDGIMQKELAKSRNLNDATVTRALDRLEKKGFVKRVSDETDKRKRKVLLTEMGENTIDDLLKKHEELKKELFKDFDEKEYDELITLLNKVMQGLKNI